MGGTRLQFHGTREEMLAWAAAWAREHNLTIAVEQFFPYVVAVPPRERLDVLPKVDRIALRDRPFDVTDTTGNEFVARNHDVFWMTIGNVTPYGLGESSIGGFTEDAATLALWKRLIRRLRSQMHKGAVVRNDFARRADPLPSHLHTEGAHALAAAGVRMSTGGDGLEFVFDDLNPSIGADQA